MGMDGKGRRERSEGCASEGDGIGLAMSVLDGRGQRELEDAELNLQPKAEGSSLIQGVGT